MIPLGPVTSLPGTPLPLTNVPIYGQAVYGTVLYGGAGGMVPGGTTYTAAQVAGFLTQPSLEMRWFFDLLGPGLNYKADLTSLVDAATPPEIQHDSTRAVKRTLNLRVRPSASANPLQDLIRVRYQILAPDGGWLEWVLWLWMLTPPDKEVSEAVTWWTLIAPELSQLLSDAAFTSTYTVASGINYAQAVSSIVSGYGGSVALQASLPDNGKTLAAPLSWEAGTSRLKAINDLLTANAYTPAWMDGNVLRSYPYVDYNTVIPAYTFDTTQGASVALSPLREKPDYANAYNQFRVIGEDPRRAVGTGSPPPVTAYYENTRADSLISIPNWHPKMAQPIRDSKIPDNAAALARAQYEAQKAARVYSTITLDAAPWPFAQDLDVFGLVYSTTDEGTVERNYLNIRWSHRCAANQQTRLELQRVVPA